MSLPNVITCLRILLVIPYLYYLLQAQYILALMLFILAGLSDAVDGYLARYFDLTSSMGGFLDPLADKLLLMSSFVAFYCLGELYSAVFVLLMLRDLFILGAVGWLYLYYQDILKFSAIMSSKVNTALQIFMVSAILYTLAFPNSFPLWHPYLQWGVLAATLWSWHEYMTIWIRRVYV